MLKPNMQKKLHSASIFMVISTSTGILKGNELIPTAERAPRPFSPKTTINKLENPSITRGCYANPGAAFTMPNVLTTCSTLSSGPIAS